MLKKKLDKEAVYSKEQYQTALDATIGYFKRQKELDLSAHRQLLYDAFANSIGKTSAEYTEPQEGYTRKLVVVFDGVKEEGNKISPEKALEKFQDTLRFNLTRTKNQTLSREI